MNINDVTWLEESIGCMEASPGPVIRSHDQLFLTDAGRYLIREHTDDHCVHIISRLRRHYPIRMLEPLHADTASDDVEHMAPPPVPTLVGRQPLQHGAIRNLLQIEIERGVH